MVDDGIDCTSRPRAATSRTASGNEATRNFTVASALGDRLFVKIYPSDADLAAERDAIRVCQFAAGGGVPAVTPIPSTRGDLITRHDGLACPCGRS
jgi:Ser/Thr protein kinase RdoA (MazF antagonist)